MMKKQCFIILLGLFLLLAVACGIDNEATEKLYQAIEEKDYQTVSQVLDSGESVSLENCRQAEEDYGDSRLLAISLEDEKMCRLLVNAGADLNSRNAEGATYLQDLIDSNGAGIDAPSAEVNMAIFDRLLDLGADVNAEGKGEYKGTALEFLMSRSPATTYDYNIMYQKLISSGAEVTEQVFDACMESESRFLYTKPLLQRLRGTEEEPDLSPPLSSVILDKPDAEILKGIKAENYKKKEALPILFFAAANCEPQVVEELKKREVDVTQHANIYLSLLDIASMRNQPKMIRYLIAEGQDLEESGDGGYEIEDGMDPQERELTLFQQVFVPESYTPLSWALVYGNKQNMECLLEAGAEFQENVWCIATIYGGKQAVDLLLSEGYQPAEYFAFQSFIYASDEMVKYMLEKDISYNVCWHDGTELLDFLKETGNEERYQLISETIMEHRENGSIPSQR